MTDADERAIVAAVRDWVDREVVPVASRLEHADEFPSGLVEQMRELGLFGVTVPERGVGEKRNVLTPKLGFPNLRSALYFRSECFDSLNVRFRDEETTRMPRVPLLVNFWLPYFHVRDSSDCRYHPFSFLI